MFKLMREQQLIAESDEPIVYDDVQRAWSLPRMWYCDSEKAMHVVDTSVPVDPNAPPNVVG